MNIEEFIKLCSPEAPEPTHLSPALRALRWDKIGNWENAHTVAQEGDTQEGAWVHAYLHRKEGDAGNARYWYVRAEKPECALTLDEEWNQITQQLV